MPVPSPLPLPVAGTPSPVRNAAWADRLGVVTSAACVVHCLVTPLLLSVSAMAAHLLPSEEHTHRTLAVGVALLGTLALVRGLRRHRRRSVLWLMLAGLTAIGAAAWLGDRLPRHWMEVAITLCGSALMITAHRLNHTFCEDCGYAAEGCALGI